MSSGSHASPLRVSPLDAWHRANGARMVAFGGWDMPLEFGQGTLAEHMACRRRSAVFDVSHLGTVRLARTGSRNALQKALTNDLGKIAPGRAQYTHLLDENGSVLDDLIVWWLGEERFDVMPNASNTSRVLGALGGDDVTASRAILAVQGPQARAVVAEVFPEAAAVGHFRVKELAWGGAPVTVAGTGYTGEDGVELAVPPEIATRLWEAIGQAGATPAGLGARDTLRLEAGLPLHGHELGPGITPLEAGLSWVVAWDKAGGFVGREALLCKREAGLDRVLRGVAGPGRQPLRAGYPVEAGGARTELTSGNFSPVLGRGIGMCFLPPGLEEGAVVEVRARGAALPCRAQKLPFVVKAATAKRAD
ncbi:MAG: glycine cleavage system aminomethyltransferase GcvT [Acidimicrobiales bacterium]